MQPSLRASDADRQRVADVLSDAYADGRLSMDEFNERNDAVWASKTLGELVPITADLGGAPATVAVGAGRPLVRVDDVPAIHTYAIMSTRSQPQDWVVPSAISAVVLMGQADYDFRRATFVSPRVEINVGVLMGSIVLSVPDGVGIIDKTVCIMGSSEFKGMTPAAPGAPVIELSGLVCMGSIEIRGAEYSTFLQRLGIKA